MSIIGELAVNVAMKTLGFDKSKRRVRSGMRDMALAAKRTTSAFKKMAGALGVGLGVGSIAFALKRTANQLDNLAKTSRKLGLAAQQLDGLRFAAGQTGVAANTLDMALQRMVRRVSEAASGTGAAKDALRELGISAKALNQLAPDQQFLRIAEAMRGVSGQSDKVRLAFKLFDSEGVNLVNTLGEGSNKIREMMEEAKKLSGTLDDSTLKQVERFNDELAKLSKISTGGLQRIVIQIAPGASDLVEGLVALTEFSGRKDTSLTGALEAVIPLPESLKRGKQASSAPNARGNQLAFSPRGQFAYTGQIQQRNYLKFLDFFTRNAEIPGLESIQKRAREARATPGAENRAKKTRRKFRLELPADLPRKFLGAKLNQAMGGIGRAFQAGLGGMDQIGQGVRGAQMALAVEALKQQLGPGRAVGKSKEPQRKQIGSLASLSAFESESVRGFRALRQNLRKDEERLGLDKTRNQTLDRIAIASEKFAEELENLGQNETVTIPPA